MRSKLLAYAGVLTRSLQTDAAIPDYLLRGLLTLQCSAATWPHRDLRFHAFALLQAIASRWAGVTAMSPLARC